MRYIFWLFNWCHRYTSVKTTGFYRNSHIGDDVWNTSCGKVYSSSVRVSISCKWNDARASVHGVLYRTPWLISPSSCYQKIKSYQKRNRRQTTTTDRQRVQLEQSGWKLLSSTLITSPSTTSPQARQWTANSLL